MLANPGASTWTCNTHSRASEKTLVLSESEERPHGVAEGAPVSPALFTLPSFFASCRISSGGDKRTEWNLSWPFHSGLLGTVLSYRSSTATPSLLLVFHHLCKCFWERRKIKMQLCHSAYGISFFNSDCDRTVTIKDSRRRSIYMTTLYFSLFVL